MHNIVIDCKEIRVKYYTSCMQRYILHNVVF
jgi:hypothetical protein